jgi:hypothetical protein
VNAVVGEEVDPSGPREQVAEDRSRGQGHRLAAHRGPQPGPKKPGREEKQRMAVRGGHGARASDRAVARPQTAGRSAAEEIEVVSGHGDRALLGAIGGHPRIAGKDLERAGARAVRAPQRPRERERRAARHVSSREVLLTGK